MNPPETENCATEVRSANPFGALHANAVRFLKSEAGAVVIWICASLVIAALLTPHLHDAGKSFASNAESREYPAVLESIAKSAEKAKLDRYFSRCLLISALALLPFLIRRVKKIPDSEDHSRYALKNPGWFGRFSHLSCGLLTGVGALGALALVLHLTGASEPNGESVSLSKLISKAFIPALGAGIIEELVFRGLLLGLWLRACCLWSAWIGTSLIFSFLHFLKPPPGLEPPDPGAWHSGFEILGNTLVHFTNPLFFITSFTTLALLGLVLAYTRTRTHSLWFPIGLHVGLVFALKLFSLTQTLDRESPLHPWFIGANLTSGILPMIAILICFAVSAFLIRFLTKQPRPCDPELGHR